MFLILLLLLPPSGNAFNLCPCNGAARFHQTTLILPTTTTRRVRTRLIFLLGRDDSHPVPHVQQRTTSKRHDGPSHALSSSTFMLFAKKTSSSTDQGKGETTKDNKEQKDILKPQTTDNDAIQRPAFQEQNIIDLIIDPILTSPFFATFLFWLPFLANDKLRHRVTTFLSTYLDLTIAIPTTGICLILAVMYLSYQNRLMDIRLAQETTEQALATLKEIRSAQISYNDVNPREFEMALENYEYVLRQELALRCIVPGVKVPNAPCDPFDREEDAAAVKMFLGMCITKDGKLETIDC